jgi:hypothetical protein
MLHDGGRDGRGLHDNNRVHDGRMTHHDGRMVNIQMPLSSMSPIPTHTPSMASLASAATQMGGLGCEEAEVSEVYDLVHSLIKCDTEERIQSHLTQTLGFIREKHQMLPPFYHDKDYPTAAGDCDAQMTKFWDEQAPSGKDAHISAIKKKFHAFIEEADKSERNLRKELLCLLAHQGKRRPVHPTEIEARIILLRLKFETVCLEYSKRVQGMVLDHAQKTSSLCKTDRNLGKEVQAELLKWFHNHLEDPYPRHDEKEELAARLGITPKQVAYWFANKRVRYKKRFQNQEKSISTSPIGMGASPIPAFSDEGVSPSQPLAKRRKTGQ